jgi:uncharacterized protein (DUF3820 family)
MKMPFGKHRGEDFDDLPTAYLQWIAENLDNRPELQREAEEQLKLREERIRERLKGIAREPGALPDYLKGRGPNFELKP